MRLAGRLLRPPGRGPFPAVVIVPGSEPAHRTTYDLWAYFFAAHGFAVLTYDKRGVGASGGTYDRAATRRTSSARLRRARGVGWLRRPAVRRPSRVGPRRRKPGRLGDRDRGRALAAVRFAALQSAPAMSVGRQLAYAASPSRGGSTRPRARARVAAAACPRRRQRLRPARRARVAADPSALAARLGRQADVHAGDGRRPAPDLGGRRHDFTVRVYAGGAHSLRLTGAGLIRQEQASPGFVRGVFPDLASWLRSRAGGSLSRWHRGCSLMRDPGPAHAARAGRLGGRLARS